MRFWSKLFGEPAKAPCDCSRARSACITTLEQIEQQLVNCSNHLEVLAFVRSQLKAHRKRAKAHSEVRQAQCNLTGDMVRERHRAFENTGFGQLNLGGRE